MTIGILKLTLFIHDSNSLKQKRMVLNSLKARLHNNFNVAVTEIDDEDKWQKATIAIVGVARDRKNINSSLCHIINFVEEFKNIDLIGHEIELL